MKRIDLHFDEYITVSDVSKEVTISPTLSIQPVVTSLYKRVTVKIPDSLLEPNTTYRISFGNSIKDLHEGNPFKDYTYTFSTGGYFDSLQLAGSVINAATGIADLSDVIIGLYDAAENDSAVVKHKPKYITKVEGSGNFVFKGLPQREFKIYAIKDANGNLTYDGPAGGEMIAFADKTVRSGDTSAAPIKMSIFSETQDSTANPEQNITSRKNNLVSKASNANTLGYAVAVDTSNVAKRTFDITKPLDLSFTKTPTLNKEKINLSYENESESINQPFDIVEDSIKINTFHISSQWQENKVYTLKLAKGFAKDSLGGDIMPSHYSFRTFEDADYGKIKIHLPSRFADRSMNYLLRVVADNDTVYQKAVTDTMVNLSRLRPGKYTFAIIVDKNKNGKWDTGDLFAKMQPEIIMPFPNTLGLKAGWENIVDFEPTNKERRKQLDEKPQGKR